MSGEGAPDGRMAAAPAQGPGAGAVRVLSITDNHLCGGLETRIAGCAAGLVAHAILAERFAPGSAARRAEIAAFRPFGLAAKATALASRLEGAGADLADLHPFHAHLTGLLAACLAGVPALLTFHGPASLAMPAEPWQRAALDRLVDRARPTLIAVSDEIALRLARRWPGQTVRVLANGVTPGRPALPDRGRRLAMASRLDADKLPGILDLVALVRETPGLELDLWGQGTSEAAVAAAVRARGLAGRVRLHGYAAEPARHFPRRAVVAGCGRALLEGLVDGRRGLVVSAVAVVGPVRRSDVPRLAAANWSGRGLGRWPRHAIRRWLAAPPSAADRVADLVPRDMAARFAALCAEAIARADRDRLTATGREVLATLEDGGRQA